MKWTKKELEQALIASDAQVNKLENDVDYYENLNYELEERVEELKYRIAELEEAEDNNRELSIKELKIMLCDRYALNHLTNWEILICKLEDEAGCV